MPPQWKEIQLVGFLKNSQYDIVHLQASIQAKMFESCMGKIDHVNVTESSLLLQTMLAPLFNRGVSWLAGTTLGEVCEILPPLFLLLVGGGASGVGQPQVNSMAATSSPSSSSSVPMVIK